MHQILTPCEQNPIITCPNTPSLGLSRGRPALIPPHSPADRKRSETVSVELSKRDPGNVTATSNAKSSVSGSLYVTGQVGSEREVVRRRIRSERMQRVSGGQKQ